MACETRERTGKCTHFQCQFSDVTPHGYNCVEIFPEGCEGSEPGCPEICKNKMKEHRAMKPRDLAALLRRAAAALETPKDLTKAEKTHVIEDLLAEADKVNPE